MLLKRCFARLRSCSGSEFEYFLSYGKKYCDVFLNLPGMSGQGKKWRDSALHCLQEKIVPELPADGHPEICDCKSIQIKAFDIHVACYTQIGASICDLPHADWTLLFNATDPVES